MNREDLEKVTNVYINTVINNVKNAYSNLDSIEKNLISIELRN